MMMECDLHMESQGYKYRVVSRAGAAGRPVLDLTMDGIASFYHLLRHAWTVRALLARFPKRCIDLHLWVGGRRVAKLSVP